MDEPRYEGQSDEENIEGTTLRAWVDERGAFVKEIDPNHLLGAGIEGHGTQYGFGGDEGNPFIHLQQSPYLDFTSVHPYPTEHWADLTLDETKELIGAWITDSHEKVGKPCFMGEFNVHNIDRTAWWSEIYADFEASGGDGCAVESVRAHPMLFPGLEPVLLGDAVAMAAAEHWLAPLAAWTTPCAWWSPPESEADTSWTADCIPAPRGTLGT